MIEQERKATTMRVTMKNVEAMAAKYGCGFHWCGAGGGYYYFTPPKGQTFAVEAVMTSKLTALSMKQWKDELLEKLRAAEAVGERRESSTIVLEHPLKSTEEALIKVGKSGMFSTGQAIFVVVYASIGGPEVGEQLDRRDLREYEEEGWEIRRVC